VAVLRPFRALRPVAEAARDVLAPPYDVVDTAEAAQRAAGNPRSLLHVTRPEINLPPDADPSGPAAHEQARAALVRLVSSGVLVAENAERFLAYRLVRNGRSQTGVVGCAAVADYLSGMIAVHERTRTQKEADRVEHLDAVGAHDEAVLLMYRPGGPGRREIADVLARATAQPPWYDLADPDGVEHTLWPVEAESSESLASAFTSVETLYIADGHHRSAAAALVAARRSGAGESASFPVVAFPADELTVLPYHRAVRDLAGHSQTAFLDALARDFDVAARRRAVQPADQWTFGVRLPGGWYEARLKPQQAHSLDDEPVVSRLDVAVLARFVLEPTLGIGDPRTDPRIAFVGGSRGTAELDRLVDSGLAAVAFSVPATSADDVMTVADAGLLMPPKSTWFEPKLASGLFLHPLG
jgi:uncharacterized protein (DUF1015 family)